MASHESNPDRASRRRGCLLGGAIGDALGAPIEFSPLNEIRRIGPNGVTDFLPMYGRVGSITDDTQMSVFTCEGLIRAQVRWLLRGICHPPGIVWNAYQRWLITQGEETTGRTNYRDGWLISQPLLHVRRAPGTTCLAALRGGVPGSTAHRINDSKGCGGLMRVASVGLFAKDPFTLGCELAALTHGHPNGFLSAGAFAHMISFLYEGSSIKEAVDDSMQRLTNEPESGEVSQAIRAAIDAAESSPAIPETVERLGAGWVAEEALTIAVFCALKAQTFEQGVLVAVNHSGDSDSTGSVAGNLLGTFFGEDALPRRFTDRLELADVLRGLADDLGRVLEFVSDPITGERTGHEVPESFLDKYPGH
ncbi:MAG: ADP-ribosylglycohydrolase family protein [Actinomycetota bacterium]